MFKVKQNKTKHLLQCSDCKWVTLDNIQEGVLDRIGGDSLTVAPRSQEGEFGSGSALTPQPQ